MLIVPSKWVDIVEESEPWLWEQKVMEDHHFLCLKEVHRLRLFCRGDWLTVTRSERMVTTTVGYSDVLDLPCLTYL